MLAPVVRKKATKYNREERIITCTHSLSLFSFSFLRKKKKKRKKNKRGGRGEAKTVPAKKGAGGAVERDAATAARRDRVRFRDICARHFDAVWIRVAIGIVAAPHAFAVGCAR